MTHGAHGSGGAWNAPIRGWIQGGWMLAREAGDWWFKHPGVAVWMASIAVVGCLVLLRVDHDAMRLAAGMRDETFQHWARELSWWGEFHRGPLLVLIVLSCWGRSHLPGARVRLLQAGVLAMGVSGIIANLFKVIVGRPRPCTAMVDAVHWFRWEWEFHGFPSGHAAHCFACAAAMAAMGFGLRTRVLLFFAASMVALSRYWLHRHYPSDLWIGAFIGLAVGQGFGAAARGSKHPQSIPDAGCLEGSAVCRGLDDPIHPAEPSLGV